MTARVLTAFALAGSLALLQTPAHAAPVDYPTVAVADYVFGCMQTNGNTRAALEDCSCSVDILASLVDYETYVEASTYLSMVQVTGEKGGLFRGGERQQEVVGNLRRAQAEAEIRCFE